MHELKILELTDDAAIIGGYGVVFGTKDLDGDTFTKETYFGRTMGKGQDVFIDHTLPSEVEFEGKTYILKSIDEPVGGIIEVEPDDVGLYMRLQIAKQSRYWQIVESMVKTLRAGLSTGTAPHLVRREDGVIKQWPINEVSITLTPAEPETTKHVQQIKSDLSGQGQGAAEGEPEVIEAKITEQPDEPVTPVDNEPIENEVTEMDEQKAVEPEVKADPVIDYETLAAKIAERMKPQSNGGIAAKAATVTENKLGRGDRWDLAFKHWIATGDGGGLELPAGQNQYELKASNPTDMNIGTAADGGNAVPTGFLAQIIARRDESDLAARLPIMRVPGIGTTVDVPLDGEADGEFVSTAEAGTFDEDAPALGKKSLTLVKYTKFTDVSYELLEDTPTNLLGFLADFVGRGIAKTRNSLLLTEVGTNGTSFKTFASNSAIAFGEPEDIVGNNDLSAYLDEDSAVAWVMRSATHWDIKSIVGSDRQYAVNMDDGRTLLGYPVLYSQKAAAIGASAKSVYFGNWRYVAMREAPGLTFLRNPYSVANSGQVRLHWYFRTVFGVLQAEAIGYGVHVT